MLRRSLLLILSALFILSMGSLSRVHSQDLSFLSDSVSYAWPTDASRYLSSTFAETRSAHLHSGLDIRTWGREGYKVLAARDGELYRIGIGPSGYGMVLYLKHLDGSFTVYAHMQRFRPDIQAYADSIRMEDFRFEIDHFVEEDTFTFKKGELIGYTGSTGVGPPHLHFEVRTPDFEPFNPLLTNLSIDDTLPPVFSSIAIESLHPETLQFEDFEIVRPDGETDGVHNFGTISTDSPIGISVNVHDRANRTPNFYAVYELFLIADEDTLFHSQVNNFDFNEASMMFVDRSYPILAQTRRGFQRLYNVNGNQLPIYKRLQNRGLLGLTPGEQTIKIVATDFYGNKKEARFTLLTEGDTSFEQITSVPAYPIRMSGNENKLRASASAHVNPAPSYRLLDNSSHTRGPSSPMTNNSYLLTNAENNSISLKTLIPGRKEVIHSPMYRSWVEIPQESLYDTLSLSMEYGVHNGLPKIEFQPNRLPVRDRMEFTMLLPEDLMNDPSIGLYSYDEFRDRYTYLDSKVGHGVLKASINEFAELRIKRDLNAPWVGNAKFQTHPTGISVVHLPVVDRDSGIDYRRSKIEVDGERGIIEYDGDKDQLIFYNPSMTFTTKTYDIDVRVYDRTGNVAERSYKLTLDK
jgi:hypothetical protein